ncbi:MFS transporter [Streptosporangium sp. NPDC049376]|uniref:MFS transporter n=1 Tax=Streptosporangium sp. NPDC049376 TaxID=3366192 RepID=UPI0037956B7C
MRVISSPLAPYARVLAVPGARGMAVSGVLARLPVAVIGVSIVIMVAARYGSYGLGGAVTATQTLCYAVFGPPLSRAADRLGQRRVVVPASLAAVTGLTGLVVCGSLRAPAWTLFGCAALVGLMPNVGSMVRARWAHLLQGTDRLHTAYAMESVVDDLIFIVGPVLAVNLSLVAGAEAGLVAAAVLLFTGCRLLASRTATEPPVVTVSERRGGVLLKARGLWAVVAVCTAMGGLFGSVEVAVVGFATEHRQTVLASWILALYALGSGISGVLFGRRRLSWSVPRQLTAAAILLTLTTAPMLVTDNLYVLGGVLLVSGAACAPILILATGLVERLVPPERLTEGMTWISTGLGAGVALGAPMAGWTADEYGGNRVFLTPLLCCVVVTLAAVMGTRRLSAAQHPAPGR